MGAQGNVQREGENWVQDRDFLTRERKEAQAQHSTEAVQEELLEVNPVKTGHADSSGMDGLVRYHRERRRVLWVGRTCLQSRRTLVTDNMKACSRNTWRTRENSSAKSHPVSTSPYTGLSFTNPFHSRHSSDFLWHPSEWCSLPLTPSATLQVTVAQIISCFLHQPLGLLPFFLIM